jgi:hypothetical protein
MPVHGADADTGGACHLSVLYLVAAIGEQGTRRFQYASPVALRVGALSATGRGRRC